MDNQPKKPFYKKKLFWIIAVIVIIIWAGSSGSKKNTNSTNTQGAPTAQTEVATKVTATTLMKDYEANEVAADQKYKNKLLEVTGTINTIGKDLLDNPYISLVSNNPILGVQCMFDKDKASELASLSKGASVTLQGTDSGKMGNIVLKDCTIVK